jgi:sulfite reductase (ferredoxin)
VAAARSLLIVYGLEPKKDREIFTSFHEQLIDPGWVKAETTEIIEAALDWRMGDKDSIIELAEPLAELVERVESLFLSLDANLKFRVQPYASKETSANDTPKSHRVDLRGVVCPMNFVKAKLALEKIKPGEILEVILDEGEPAENVPDSFAQQGQEVLEVSQENDYCRVAVRRRK